MAPCGHFVIGYASGRPVATGGWRLHTPIIGFASRRPAEIRRMYVAESARGRGFAQVLLAHLETTAQRAGADALVLETGRPQVAAVILYRAAGYDDIPSFGHYAAEDDAVHLGKLLPGTASATARRPGL
jgi:GNAT superfamily N-acetyltransferase